ncbi:MAG: hydroxymethylglutaryl-CoA reductase, degradative [Deltaproteobacteria bacterium]|nr:hydroxymethylglutaryl-CoA reductase, degradative [Deltaproteobacteria bacterium]
MDSRLSGLYRLDLPARRDAIRERAGLPPSAWVTGLSEAAADLMTENVLTTLALPNSVAVNLQINGEDVLVPMTVEEPSVVAAVSNMARLARRSGGFHAEADESVMIGQVQLAAVRDPQAVAARLRAALPSLEELAAAVHPGLARRGGGLRGMEVRTLRFDHPEEPPEDMVVLHFFLDCADAMGANLVNTLAEALAAPIEELTGERVGLRILSNLADRRLARAAVAIDPRHLAQGDLPGDEVAARIAAAWRFAWADPYRAATHNKGVMNGIDAVAIATGNDWRALEAGAHAFAARDGQYRPLSRWTLRDGLLRGSLELPLQVGVVGGPIKVHPTVQDNLALLGSPSARGLARVMAAVGLAQNLGALRALAAEGIQRGHMRMHARTVAVAAGATAEEVPLVVARLAAARDYSSDRAAAVLAELRAR